jgi:hypothetical protein
MPTASKRPVLAVSINRDPGWGGAALCSACAPDSTGQRRAAAHADR